MKLRHCLIVLLYLGSGCFQGSTYAESDIPMLKTVHLTADYWLTKVVDANTVLLTQSQIVARNVNTVAGQPEMTALASLSDSLIAADLSDLISKASASSTQPRFYADGKAVSAEQWQAYQYNLNTDGVKALNAVGFALVVKRTDLRSMPTADRVHNENMALDLDRFQETALFPGEAVAVLHTSRDKQWLLVQNYHYTGWVQAEDIAQGKRHQVLDYTRQQPFLVVTAARALTSFTPQMPAISQLLLDMGTRLPLLSTADTGHNVHGQNPHASYIVKLPIRNHDGILDFTAALIARQQDVSVGYLPYTPANVLQQAFKFLGDRYGWGHDYDSRDCTGFIIEIYRSFGLIMPRNSGQQGKGNYGQNSRFTDQSTHFDKLAAISKAQPGDLIYRPGHVMLYLGEENGEPFVIHSVHELAYFTETDTNDTDKNDTDTNDTDSKNSAEANAPTLYQGVLNGVAVTPLTPLQLTVDSSYLDKIYAIKSLR